MGSLSHHEVLETRNGNQSLPGKSIHPSLSVSASLIMSCSSDLVGFSPNELITSPSSFTVMFPNWVNVKLVSIDEFGDEIHRRIWNGEKQPWLNPRDKCDNLQKQDG